MRGACQLQLATEGGVYYLDSTETLETACEALETSC